MINKQFPLALTFTLFLTSALTGCSDEDFLTTQSDETKVLSFSIGTDMEEITSKASSEYRAWHSGDPTSFGAYGLHDQGSTTPVFNNQQVNRVGSLWEYTPLQYWADYTWCKNFDFFGYMPYQASDTGANPQDGAKFDVRTLTGVGSGAGIDTLAVTLSFPVTLKDVANDTIVAVLDSIEDGEHNPLICNLPVHKTKVGEVINFRMDQTLTGFCLKFQLGTKMSNIRDFIIKEVKVTGAKNTIPVGGVVSRTYKFPKKDGGAWTAGNITWSDITKNTDKAKATEIPFVDYSAKIGKSGIYDNTNKTLRIGYSEPEEIRQWGANFYAIPSAEFAPTISVKYDVVVVDEDTNDVTTRENIVSEIQFSSDYFNTYTAAGAIGQVNPIVVQIIPKYLYVLADADQRLGYVVVE